MTEPDLSFLDPAAWRHLAPVAPLAAQRAPAAGLSAEALVAELERQNEVLRYSQAVAESTYERFETLFASVPLALMVLDSHDVVVQANAMAHRCFQPGERDRPLTALLPFVRAQDAPRVQAAFAQARNQGHSQAKEVVFAIGADGRITGDLHIARIEAPQDALPQFLCAVIDQGPLLAERQALQRSARALQQRNGQLHASQKRLAAVIDAALDAIVCVDQHQRITVFNPRAAALFQCHASDALGSRLERFLPDAAAVLAQARSGTREMMAQSASGQPLALEVSLSFERHAQGQTTTVFARDLTGRKKAEAERNELEAQLRESHKMQAVGTMAGGIAHDFNNILGAILGNVALAQADCAPDSPVLQSLLEIDKAGRRARDLVRQILTFSRNQPPQRSVLSLADMVHDTERLLRVTLPPAIGLQMQLQPGLPWVLADATQVGQALLNLCTNAIHAIGSGRGSIHVEAATVSADQHLIERLGLAPGDYVALSVRDTGPGMDAATLERIFEPFFTTKPVGQGTGLGLAVVHGVMRSHEGSVAVHSRPGQGSCFTLYFPVAPGSAQQAAAGPEPVAPALFPGNTSGNTPGSAPANASADMPSRTPGLAESVPRRQPHVMYVDDDPALVFLVQRLLRRRGYAVSGYSDPRQARAALRAAPQDYDLLVTDYNMPGFCGVDLVREARSIRPELPVALTSGHVTAEIEQAALAEGARALIHKPDDVQALCATVQGLLAGNDPGAPAI
ncbi:PAS domain-containing hybrid sensor histidine kinase/response regulator [Verminephrobacter eiseniae]|uniref:histidine kinase n=2 Tax=Verminephrobacter eiseniae TaxID=364317 RepID=A1WRC5_VEREI|nr:ATP-binding protein [Verminephrobacter eiseniae]ABM60182.1 PAS/PAC sensor hybrid histidine kinase [Verminephrobacter eiseniae EF01-2]MCW5285672.1 response regulator [Verminephrobacter eiseniae]MCW5303972.1 response regulator [Verminephrobacter eiseniae]MCW8190339.1 response regulator [Verminephrobacter eiseniae]